MCAQTTDPPPRRARSGAAPQRQPSSLKIIRDLEKPGQAQFLINCGITDLLAQTDAADARRYAPLASAANRLLSPAEMGELFKVLAVGRGVHRPLAGFAQGDRARAL